MKQIFAITVAIAILATIPIGQAQASSQIERLVAHELETYAPGTDASRLSTSQLSRIYLIMHSRRSESDKRALIKSTIGGSNTLRGFARLQPVVIQEI